MEITRYNNILFVYWLRHLFTASSIHTSRLFSGYRDTLMSSSGRPRVSVLRLLGPTTQSAIAVGTFWLLALALNAVLFARAGRTLFNYDGSARSGGRHLFNFCHYLMIILSWARHGHSIILSAWHTPQLHSKPASGFSYFQFPFSEIYRLTCLIYSARVVYLYPPWFITPDMISGSGRYTLELLSL